MIFEFENYQSYLNHYLQRLPKQGHGEARKISALLGVSSTFISHVFSGQKLLTPEQAEKLTDYLGLTGLEADYFFYLVQLERAGTERLKKFCRTKLAEIKQKSLTLSNRLNPKKVLNDQERSVFYSNALFSAIHLYTSTGVDGRTLDEIAARFELTRSKTAELISFLVDADLVKKDDNRYTMGTQSTHLAADSPDLLRHHANWRLRALQASESLSEDELMYTVNVSLSNEDFGKLREEMIAFIKSFLKTVHASPADELACLNLDFFRIRK
jgi:uncharacterized protein (TIGR02147 family)